MRRQTDFFFEGSAARIPIRIRGGEVTYFYEGSLPAIRDGTVGDLVIPKAALTEAGDAKRFAFEEKVELLPAGVMLYVELADRATGDGVVLRGTVADPFWDCSAGRFTVVELLEPLNLRLRGTKLGTLLPTRCRIPALNLESKSLNQAYSALARHFEPWRDSAAGNVFKKMYYKSERCWRKLETLRGGAEAKLEARLFELRPDVVRKLDESYGGAQRSMETGGVE